MTRLLFLPLLVWSASAQPIAGDWTGTLEAGPQKLRLVLHVKQSPSGLTAALDSLDQGAMGLPASKVAFSGGALNAEFAVVGGSYEAKLSEDGRELRGTWSQGSPLPLVFTRSAKPVEGPKRPQEPKAPFPYDVEEVSVSSAEGVTLACSLTLPKGEGKHPAAVLITGSGPQNRDEELMGHKPFLVLADALTRREIAVLRCDDRGFAKSTGTFRTATSADFADDAQAEAAFLRKHARIDVAKVGLIGHSEGGLVAPMVAGREPATAFVVLIAAPGVNGEQILKRQIVDILKASGAPEEAIEVQRTVQQSVIDVVKTEADPAARAEKLKAITAPMGKAGEAMARNASSAWFRNFVIYDPLPALGKVKCPVLALNGSLDLQVAADQNLGAVENALRAGGNKDVTAVKLDGLNHLLQTAKTGSVAEYAQIEETVAPAALKRIGDWLAGRVLAK